MPWSSQRWEWLQHPSLCHRGSALAAAGLLQEQLCCPTPHSEGLSEPPPGCQNQIKAGKLWQRSSEWERTGRQRCHGYEGII